MQLSFVILTYRRPDLLRRCLASLAQSRWEGAEVLLGFNGPDPSNAVLVQEIRDRYPWVHVVEMERCSRGGARNRLVQRSLGKIVYFLDDDTEVLPEFVDLVKEKFKQYPEVSAIGGPNIAPRDSGVFEQAVDSLLCSFWGAGPTRIRNKAVGTDRLRPGWWFTLSNLGVRRSVFERDKIFFSESCVSAEENLLLFHVERAGGPILYSPQLQVFHRRRDRLRAFCRQAYTSGRGRGQITRWEPASFQYFAVFPVAWMIYLVSLFWTARTQIFLVPLLIYAAWGMVEGVRTTLKAEDIRAALWFPLLGLTGHVSYALGMIAGMIAPGTGS